MTGMPPTPGFFGRAACFPRTLASVTFVVTGLVLGTFHVAFEPPISTFDAEAHYYRTWMLAHGEIRGHNYGDNRLGTEVQRRDVRFVSWCRRLPNGEISSYSREELQIVAQRLEHRSDAPSIVWFTNTAINSPLNYVPQVLGFWVGQASGLGILGTYRTSCMANLLAFIALGLICLRILPHGHLLCAGFLLIPMVLAQAATQSIDGINLVLPMVLLAWLWHLREDGRRIDRNALAATLALCVGVCLLKATAAVFLGALILLRRRQFASPARWFVALATCMIAGISAWYAWNRPHLELDTASYFGLPGDPPAQWAILFETPSTFLRAALRFVANNTWERWGSGFLHPQVPVTEGSRDLWPALRTMALVTALLLTFTERKAHDRTAPMLIGGIGVANYLLILFVFWIGYTPPDTQHIDHVVQGRYLTLFFLLVFLALPALADRWTRDWKRWDCLRKRAAPVLFATFVGLDVAGFVSLVSGWTVRLY